MVSLLLASMKYLEYHPLGLLIDLGQTWYIIWRDGNTIWYYPFKSADNAIKIGRHAYKNFHLVLKS
jgi:hypothetical protein